MIIVLNPWQFALCPSPLCSFVTPKVLSPSMLLRWLQSKVRTLQGKAVSFMGGEKFFFKPTTPHDPENGGGEVP